MYTLITKLHIDVELKHLFCEREYQLPFAPYPGLNINGHGEISKSLRYDLDTYTFTDNKRVHLSHMPNQKYEDVKNLMLSRGFFVTNTIHGFDDNGEKI